MSPGPHRCAAAKLAEARRPDPGALGRRSAGTRRGGCSCASLRPAKRRQEPRQTEPGPSPRAARGRLGRPGRGAEVVRDRMRPVPVCHGQGAPASSGGRDRGARPGSGAAAVGQGAAGRGTPGHRRITRTPARFRSRRVPSTGRQGASRTGEKHDCFFAQGRLGQTRGRAPSRNMRTSPGRHPACRSARRWRCAPQSRPKAAVRLARLRDGEGLAGLRPGLCDAWRILPGDRDLPVTDATAAPRFRPFVGPVDRGRSRGARVAGGARPCDHAPEGFPPWSSAAPSRGAMRARSARGLQRPGGFRQEGPGARPCCRATGRPRPWHPARGSEDRTAEAPRRRSRRCGGRRSGHRPPEHAGALLLDRTVREETDPCVTS